MKNKGRSLMLNKPLFKEGDIIRIKTEARVNKEFPKYLYTPSTKALMGKLFEVRRVRPGNDNCSVPYGNRYVIGNQYITVYESMIEGIVI